MCRTPLTGVMPDEYQILFTFDCAYFLFVPDDTTKGGVCISREPENECRGQWAGQRYENADMLWGEVANAMLPFWNRMIVFRPETEWVIRARDTRFEVLFQSPQLSSSHSLSS